MHTRIRISFKGKGQVSYLMIIKEFYNKFGEIKHAKVLYKEEVKESDVVLENYSIFTETHLEKN